MTEPLHGVRHRVIVRGDPLNLKAAALTRGMTARVVARFAKHPGSLGRLAWPANLAQALAAHYAGAAPKARVEDLMRQVRGWRGYVRSISWPRMPRMGHHTTAFRRGGVA